MPALWAMPWLQWAAGEKKYATSLAQATAGVEGLPPGWIYDGSVFLNFDGLRSRRRPDLDALIEKDLDARNVSIAAHNKRVLDAKLMSLTAKRR